MSGPRPAFRSLPARAASESPAGGIRAWCYLRGARRAVQVPYDVPMRRIQVIEKCFILAEREGFEPSKGF